MLENSHPSNKKLVSTALVDAFPVSAAFLPIGCIWGILWEQTGFPPFWAILYSMTVFAGSTQFLAFPFLLEGGSPWLLFFSALPIAIRNSFYTIAVIDRLPKHWLCKTYCSFALVDATFAIITHKPIEITRNPWYTLPLALAIHSYWILGACIGIWIGVYIPQSFTSINFALPSLITILSIDQFRKNKDWRPIFVALAGGGAAWMMTGHHWFLSAVILCSTITVLQPFPKKENNNHK